MTYSYDFWNKALAGYMVGGPELPVHESVPHPGFYRKRTSKGGAFEPVAIFESEGKLIARVGFRDGKIRPAEDVWLRSCEHAVTEEAYRSAVATGQWHDVDPNVTASTGHNAAPDADSIADQINTVLESVPNYATVNSDEEAAKAQSVRSRLNELAREADRLREEEKKPHLLASRKVDGIWMPLVKSAKDGANRIAAAIGKFETGKIPKVVYEPSAPATLSNETPMPTQIRGGYGRAASVKERRVLQEVVSMDALWARYRTYEPVYALLRKLAQADLDDGLEVPGIKWSIEKVVV
jgi:hypothetical protein